MVDSNFKIFDENKANIEDDATYLADDYRLNGARTGLAPSPVHNKVYYQTSIMAAAIAQLLVNRGQNASDTVFNDLVTALDAVLFNPSGDTITGQLISTLAIGTAPFAVTSTTKNTNLNADQVDGCDVDDTKTTTAYLLTASKIISLIAAKLSLTGGTLIGDVLIQKVSPELNIDATTGYPVISFKEATGLKATVAYNVNTNGFYFKNETSGQYIYLTDAGAFKYYNGVSSSEIWHAGNDDRTGSILWHAANTAPTGYLKCNGAAISRTTYASLFTAISTTFGVGNGSTTFNIPDLRGEFLRGWDDARGVDTGRVFGSAQINQVGEHSLPFISASQDMGDGGILSRTTTVSGDSTTVLTGTETRPRNIALLPCIKY